MTGMTYNEGAELPSFALTWRDRDGNLIDFSSAYTFTVMAIAEGATITLSPVVAGAAINPNVVVEFTVADMAALDPEINYRLIVRANRTSDSKDRDFPGPLSLYIREIPAAAI